MSRHRLHTLTQRLQGPPGILGREHYRATAVLVPLVLREGREHLLFEKRAAHIPQGSEICFPGGYFDHEHDTSFLDTALRETEEELGLGRERIEILGQLETLVSPRGLIVECFLGLLDWEDLSDLHLARDEVEAVFTVPLQWFMDNPPAIYHSRVELQSSYVDEKGVEQVLLPVERLGLPLHYKENRSEWLQRVVVYMHDAAVIWGLTAALVENFVEHHFRPLAQAQGPAGRMEIN